MQTTINPSEPQSESLFNYHQVFRENYHNVQQKGDKQVNNFHQSICILIVYNTESCPEFFSSGADSF